MAEAEQQQGHIKEEDDDHDGNTLYKPPAEKSLDDIIKADQEDESLRKYKETLLGNVENTVFFPDDPRKVIMRKMCIVVSGRDDMELDLAAIEKDSKPVSFTIKEGARYQIRVVFNVQREIVTGLKYVSKITRGGLPVGKETYMVGSYGPRKEEHSYLSPPEDAPSGLISRGTYTVESLFTDDDKNKYMKWTWKIEVKKDWE